MSISYDPMTGEPIEKLDEPVINETPAEETPVQEAPAEEAPAEETPAQEIIGYDPQTGERRGSTETDYRI